MNDRWWAAVLVYPAPLYAGLLTLQHFWAGSFLFPLGFGIALAFGSATGFGLLRRPAWVWWGRLCFVVVSLVPVAYGSLGSGAVLDLACGIAVGSPFLWLEYAWRDNVSPGARVLALELALLIGLLGLASIGAAPPGASAGGQYLQGVNQVLAGQVRGIADVLTGVSPPSMPLESTLDVVYAALGGLGLAGVVLPWASPRTALDEPLPWSWLRRQPVPAPSPAVSEELGLRPGQRDALATRTLPHAPEAMGTPGFGAFLVMAALVLGFVALAVSAPSYALLALVLGTVGAFVVVALVLSRRLTQLGGLSA
jgi:hypothetical protein